MPTPAEEQALQDAILQQSIEEQQQEEAQGSQQASPQDTQPPATPQDLAAGQRLMDVTKDPAQVQRDAVAAREAEVMANGGAVDPSAAMAPMDPNGPGVGQKFGQLAQDAHNTVSAFGGGVMEGAFQQHDFFMGATPEDQKSDFRKYAEKKAQGHMDALGPAGGLVSGLGQFAEGMVGLSALTKGLQALPWVGKGVTALSELAGSSKLAKAAVFEGKAALVSATSFDPHQERLSNLLTQFPIFTNSVTSYLAAKPGDTAGEGRLKNVIEGLGLSAAVGGLFMGTTRLYKALASGDKKAISEASDAVLKAQQKAAADGSPNAEATAEAGNASVPDPGSSPGVPVPGDQGAVPQVAPAKPRISVTTNQDGSVTFTPKQFLDAAEGKTAQQDLTGTQGSPNSGPSAAGGNDNVGSGVLSGERPGGEANAAPSGGNNPGGGLNGDRPLAPDTAPPAVGSEPPVSRGDGARASDQGTGPSGPEGGPPSTGGSPGADSQVLSAVPNATEGLAQEGITGQKPKLRPIETLSDPQVDDLIKKFGKDWEALDERGGSWNDAVADGHKFSTTTHTIPYQLMAGPDDARAFIARLGEARAKQFAAIKGGDVVSDTKFQRMVEAWSKQFNEDPSAVIGKLVQAGKDAPQQAALMDMGIKISNRVAMDMTATAKRIELGVASAADRDLLKQQMVIYEMALGPARSLLSNAGRTLRRARGDLGLPKASDLAALRSLDSDRIAHLLVQADGDPKKIRLALNASLGSKLMDGANFLLVNNLLWGWKSHLVNFMSNGYMLASRPAERIIGSLGMGNVGASVREQAYKQYYYMGASLLDSFRAAKDAFVLGDSVLSPHSNSLYRNAGPEPGTFKPVDSVASLGHNAIAAVTATIGLPTRALAAADEMMKTITYRSMVMAKADAEARQLARANGLDGSALAKSIRDNVTKRLDEAFDDMGRAVDTDALQEAKTATFSQDLLPGTFGKGVQNFTTNVPAMRLILPFVKTPTNIIRYSWKLTPGLNLLQKEFQQALTGGLGDTPEIALRNQMQARGQLALATSFLGAAAYLASQGAITGGGPADPKARKDLMATGWRPYSFRTVNQDGTVTYNAMGSRMDPLVMPFGIVADIVAAAQHPEGQDGLDGAVKSLAIALAKNVSNRSYLVGLSQALDAWTSPTEDRTNNFAGGLAGNMVPMASMLRQVNPDPYLRDARSIADKVLATIPGLSEGLPPRRDTWGDPMTVIRGFSSTADGVVDQEMERLIMDTPEGRSIAGVTPTGSGYDLRQVTMEDGKNAYDRLQELSGHLPGAPALKSLVAKVMQSDAYLKAPDGSSSTKGTKLYMLGSVINPYHEKAKKLLMADRNVRKAMYTANEQVRAAYAAKQRDPNGAIPQRNAVNRIMETFGLGGLGGGDQQ